MSISWWPWLRLTGMFAAVSEHSTEAVLLPAGTRAQTKQRRARACLGLTPDRTRNAIPDADT